MHRVEHERGQALLLVMIAMVPICLVLGLVVDAGMAYYTKTSARAAAQMAALAAVQRAMDLVYQGATYACGASNLGCELSPTACTSNPPLNLQSACSYAQANGFSLANIWVDANTTPPPVTGASNVQYWVRVQILQPKSLTFGIFSGLQQLNVAASAVAAAANMLPSNCIVTLNPTANDSLTLNGSLTVAAPDCGVDVNSNATQALLANGPGSLTATSIGIAGNYLRNGDFTLSPTPSIHTPHFTDPLEGVAAPVPTASCSSTSTLVINSNTTLSPGTYCGQILINDSPTVTFSSGTYQLVGGLLINGSGSVTFGSGTYYLMGGGLTSNGSASLSGSGVTFYNTCSTGSCATGSNFQPITLNGSGTLNFSAPSSGPLEDILFFEDRKAPANYTNTINGTVGANLKGAVYFPVNQLIFNGSESDEQFMMVANTITMNGSSSNWTLNPNAGGTPITPQISAALIQ